MHAKQKGFTLIELLVVIAIIAIMAVIALPNMSQWIASRRAASNAEQIANLLRFARAEAVRLNLPVYVCPVKIRKDGKPLGQCDSTAKDSGLLAFADKDYLVNPNKKQTYTNDSVDIHLRTIILNSKDSNRVIHHFSHVPKGQESLFWTFLPNGNFGYSTDTGLTKDTKFIMSNGYIKISMTDASATNDDDKKARASVLFIDGNGRVEICPKNDSRKQCEYPTN
ncbi:pilus assembly FimT family protein [Neisseria sp. CCUG12390]|uniref:pilus assembly FimT family protein n=1 Tax=Neisseria sp. CCUG12390 TaxID=3392035 RepID=UPI003A0FC937